MADLAQYLSVVSYGPTLQDTNVGVSPEIKVRFASPIDTTLVETASGLNRYVILVDMDSDAIYNVTYDEWDSVNKILTFTPSEALQAGRTYQVTIRKTLRNSQGRAMLNDRSWVFQTTSGAVSQVTLREPGDSTAWSYIPQLEWDGVTVSGSVSYDVQLQHDWQFREPLLWSTTQTTSGSGGVQTANIGTSLTERRTYYWRVRARTSSVTGEWSDTRAFWFGSSLRATPDTLLVHEPDALFRLQTVYPPNGTPNLSDWPTIALKFTKDVDSDTVDSSVLYLWAAPVDGRVGVLNSNESVSGTITVEDDIIYFVPSVSIRSNTRYTLIMGNTVESTSGDALEVGSQTYFTSNYSPLYGGLIAVRAALGGFVNSTSDDEIFFALWQGSITANQLYMRHHGYTMDSVTYADVVSYVPTTVSWGMHRYSELEAAINLLESYYVDLLEDAGRRSALGTFETELKVEVLPELRKRIEELKKERDQVAATALIGLVVPRAGMKSQGWPAPDVNGFGSRSQVDQSYTPRKRF